jgi:hypothetical protein
MPHRSSDCADPHPGGMLGPPMTPTTPTMRGPACTSPGGSSSKWPFGAWRGVIVGLVAGAMLVAGCGKSKPSMGTEAPGDAGEAASADSPSMAEPGDDGGAGLVDGGLSSYESELEGYEDAMLATGVALPGIVMQTRTDLGKPSVPATADDPTGQRCERICGLATNICGLRDRICELVDDHGNELRYVRACERANLDCERATEVCEGCDD